MAFVPGFFQLLQDHPGCSLINSGSLFIMAMNHTSTLIPYFFATGMIGERLDGSDRIRIVYTPADLNPQKTESHFSVFHDLSALTAET